MGTTHADRTPVTFEQVVRSLYPTPAAPSAAPRQQESLASLTYAEELELKNRAFARYLRERGVEREPEPVVPSPMPRAYRTTTKRRAYWHPQGVGLGFASPVKPGVCVESALEPPEHHRLYAWVLKTLSRDTYTALARVLNWVIIRGGYERRFLILNIFKTDAEIVRKLKQLAVLMEREGVVEGAMAYIDTTRSEYYLEAEKPPKGLQTKHLFGSKLLGLEVDGVLMRYPPTVFSQVNESMVTELIRTAREFLQPEPTDHLLDLYCGYGLFSHTLGRSCGRVIGVESSREAVLSAQEIARRRETAGTLRFQVARIDFQFVETRLAEPAGRELVLLDPPRGGCEDGVIAALASRRPDRVLHLFCGADAIPDELRLWQRAGYEPVRIRPLDMFPGTPNLETLVLLERPSPAT
jgi:tRNA/tmRNA/rRNA uracil-C5-methylase (TrmA/RlmC/RlmD family)